MLGAVQGFTTICAVVALGWLLGHLGVLDLAGRKVLADVAFFVASPALLLVVLAEAPLSAVVSPALAVAAGSALTVMLVAAAVARYRWGMPPGERVMAALNAGYTNAGNLGLPIAVYVLGDAAHAAPVLLLQLLVVTPVSMALLDAQQPGARVGVGPRVRSLVGNPITAGALLGLLLSVTGTALPALIMAPVSMVANLAVPAMLLAFGVSLRLGQRPGRAIGRVVTLALLKIVAMPFAALLIGVAMGLGGHELFSVVVMAALPTAQNIFTYSLRYDRAVYLTRDTIFVTTMATVPAILLVTVLFHA